MITIAAEVTPVVEEYLESIWRLEEKSGIASTGDVSKDLQVAMGTVTNTVQRLEKMGLITHIPYRGMRLTDEGRRIALDVIRRHRLTERLLTDVLEVDWSKVHDEACKLEHSLSREIVKSLEKRLGNPKTCPHGNPLPTTLGEIVEEEAEPLSALSSGDRGVVVKITSERADLLEYFGTLNIVPGSTIRVEQRAPFDGPITIEVSGVSHALGLEVAAYIWIKKID
ncbi:MAG: metal-dependent transcriptional regulator [Nitrososphaeria archaeon]|nr:metal-dependent transcriptional regulator [Nitrososphaeria archaeon]NIN52513.1 metal-dependent transcriptional regulator [Nitrososphaeria archaeon]NIQ34212.1 metal-dependent transcriptional regulator [Nitrososphaeria archaeon]